MNIAYMESCPSWSKEHDWKSCNGLTPVRGFESLALRQKSLEMAILRHYQVIFFFCITFH